MAAPLTQSEDSVLLRNISWKTYQDLLSDLRDSSTPRLAYDRGVLEITSPSPEHERYNRAIALLVEVVAEETGLDIETLGSATFKRQDLLRGFEPDSCFYIKNAEKIRGKARIDLRSDTPPDLVVEVDITSNSLDKLSICAQIGVPRDLALSRSRVRNTRIGTRGVSSVREELGFPVANGGHSLEFHREQQIVKAKRMARGVA